MANRDWTFTQLTGSDPKTFILTGYAAPFGRPRIKSVVEPGKELREERVYYPGNDRPTTHLFGTKQDDIELSGRWMDRKLGAGTAERNVRAINEMIQDQRPVRIQWGQLLSYVGWIKKLTPKWESLNECVYVINCLIDYDEFEGKKVNVQNTTSVLFDTTDAIQRWLNEGLGALRTTTPTLAAVTGQIFDTLDDLISNVTSVGATVISLSNSISNLETASFNEVERLRAGLHEFKTAVLTLQETVDSISIDSMLIDRQIEDDIAWLSYKSTAAVHTNRVLDITAVADKVAEQATASKIKTTYQAKPGDSWESISMDQYGTPDRASDIRSMNGIKGGEPPIPGRRYNIPK